MRGALTLRGQGDGPRTSLLTLFGGPRPASAPAAVRLELSATTAWPGSTATSLRRGPRPDLRPRRTPRRAPQRRAAPRIPLDREVLLERDAVDILARVPTSRPPDAGPLRSADGFGLGDPRRAHLRCRRRGAAGGAAAGAGAATARPHAVEFAAWPRRPRRPPARELGSRELLAAAPAALRDVGRALARVCFDRRRQRCPLRRCRSMPKPRLRAASAPMGVLRLLVPRARDRAGATPRRAGDGRDRVYAASVAALFGADALYHRINWRSRAPGVDAARGPLDDLRADRGDLHAVRAARLSTARWRPRSSSRLGRAPRPDILKLAWLDAPSGCAVVYVALGWVAVAACRDRSHRALRPRAPGRGRAALHGGAVVYALRARTLPRRLRLPRDLPPVRPRGGAAAVRRRGVPGAARRVKSRGLTSFHRRPRPDGGGLRGYRAGLHPAVHRRRQSHPRRQRCLPDWLFPRLHQASRALDRSVSAETPGYRARYRTSGPPARRFANGRPLRRPVIRSLGSPPCRPDAAPAIQLGTAGRHVEELDGVAGLSPGLEGRRQRHRDARINAAVRKSIVVLGSRFGVCHHLSLMASRNHRSSAGEVDAEIGSGGPRSPQEEPGLCAAHSSRASRAGHIACPHSVSAYSTLGGT